MDPSMTEKKKAPLSAPPLYKERPLPRADAERTPGRRYSPYPPPSKDDYPGQYAGSWPLPPIYQWHPSSHGLHVNCISKDGVVDKEHYMREMIAAKKKHPFWSMHTSGRPELFDPATSAEYELDPLFKDLNLDMSVHWHLLPFIGHKVASAADAPNSSGQVGTTTGYRQSDFRKFHSDVPGEKQRAPDRAYQDGEEQRDMEKKARLPSPHFQKQYTLPRAERSPDLCYTPCPPLSKDYYSGKVTHPSMSTSMELIRPRLLAKIERTKSSVINLAKATGQAVASISCIKESIRVNPMQHQMIDMDGCFTDMCGELGNAEVCVSGLLEHFNAMSRDNPAGAGAGAAAAQIEMNLISANKLLLTFEDRLASAAMELYSAGPNRVHDTSVSMEAAISTLTKQQSILGSVMYYMNQVQVGTSTGYRQSDDCLEVPVREVAALKIDDN